MTYNLYSLSEKVKKKRRKKRRKKGSDNYDYDALDDAGKPTIEVSQIISFNIFNII